VLQIPRMSAAIQMVNGFQCRNCTDVDYAKKHIDPAHPKDGPYGVDAKDSTVNGADPQSLTSGAGTTASGSGSSTGSQGVTAADGSSSDPNGRDSNGRTTGLLVDLQI